MSELFSKLGVDWQLLLSQAVNFLLLLGILTYFVYKPIISILKKRQEKIKEGLTKSEEAERRLLEASEIKKEKLKEAENESIVLIKKAEEKALEARDKILEEAKQKEVSILKNAELAAENKSREAEEIINKEAAALVKKAIVKAVELKPEEIDDKLIAKAIQELKIQH